MRPNRIAKAFIATGWREKFVIVVWEKRAKIKAWHRWVKTLPSAEQKKLREVWSTLGEAERKVYMQTLRQRYGG